MGGCISKQNKKATEFLAVGKASYKQKDFQGAVKSFKAALELRPDHAATHFNMGLALYMQSNWQEAVESFKEVLKLKHNHTTAYINMGLALHNQGDTQREIDCYTEALTYANNEAIFYCRRGEAHKLAGNTMLAAEDFKKAKENLNTSKHNKPYVKATLNNEQSLLQQFKVKSSDYQPSVAVLRDEGKEAPEHKAPVNTIKHTTTFAVEEEATPVTHTAFTPIEDSTVLLVGTIGVSDVA